MIISTILNLFKTLLFFVFGWINLPAFPETLRAAIDTIFNIIFGSVNLLGFFVRLETIKIVVPVLIILINFDKVYRLTMFILRKIPFLGLK